MLLELNIGLENNPYEIEGIMELVDKAFSLKGAEYNLVESTYLGEVEHTLAVKGDTDTHYIGMKAKALANLMTQDCIAFRYEGWGALAYNPDYEGERVKFDDSYFVAV